MSIRRPAAERSTARRLASFLSLIAFVIAGWAAVAHAGGHEDSACGSHACHVHGDDADGGHDSPDRPDEPASHDSKSCALCRVLAQAPTPVALPPPLPLPDPVTVELATAPSSVVAQSYVGFSLARGPPSSLLV